jgi:hypothetical protein
MLYKIGIENMNSDQKPPLIEQGELFAKVCRSFGCVGTSETGIIPGFGHRDWVCDKGCQKVGNIRGKGMPTRSMPQIIGSCWKRHGMRLPSCFGATNVAEN